MLLVSFEPGTLRVLMLKTEGLSIARSSEFSVVEIDLKFCIGSKLKFDFLKKCAGFSKMSDKVFDKRGSDWISLKEIFD